MNIRSQVLAATGLTIVSSDGRTFSVTRQQIRAFFVAASGNNASKRSATQTWLRNNVVTALGTNQIDISRWTVAFADADGSLTDSTWTVA
jgi:hypothetical protein